MDFANDEGGISAWLSELIDLWDVVYGDLLLCKVFLGDSTRDARRH